MDASLVSITLILPLGWAGKKGELLREGSHKGVNYFKLSHTIYANLVCSTSNQPLGWGGGEQIVGRRSSSSRAEIVNFFVKNMTFPVNHFFHRVDFHDGCFFESENGRFLFVTTPVI